ncbi:MAG: LacI family DNA-binding transcriptional regulator, partial [Arenibacter sp.]|nr:LacI family DNA-binding transcriptional regulator [Arenibacter sp.]
MKKITLKEIAQHFSVSVSTVSKAINDSHEISEELKLKIQKFAKENKYRPNKVALSLLQRKTKTIGVVVPNILNYFFTQVFSGIEKIANEHGYN